MIKYITTIILAITALMANPKGENMSNLKEIYLGGGLFLGDSRLF